MATAEIQPGHVIRGTYRIVRLIAAGGMGKVYEAEHARLAGRYAVKVVDGEHAHDKEVLDRFRREAQIASALRHPNIVPVIDFDATESGEPYLVMELLDGVDLKAHLRRQRSLPLPEVVAIVRQLAAGLGAAHSQGVVHRDLKPENIFLVRVIGQTEPLVKVLDFGISKVKKATTRLTTQSLVFGTPHYMSPEQARGRNEEVDERSDQFALAAMTYEMLAGQEAFRGEDASAVLYQVVHEWPPLLSSPGALAGPELEAVIARGLAKQRVDRYPTVAGFSEAFEVAAAVSTGNPATPRSGLTVRDAALESAIAGGLRGRGRIRRPLLLTGAALTAAALALASWWVATGRTAPASPPAGPIAAPGPAEPTHAGVAGQVPGARPLGLADRAPPAAAPAPAAAASATVPRDEAAGAPAAQGRLRRRPSQAVPTRQKLRPYNDL